jgi:hypothetical protein
MKKQRGVSLSGLLIICVVLIGIALLGFKLFPPYTEYLSIKKVINEIARNSEIRTPRDVNEAFERRSAIDNFTSVRGTDLEITKQGDRTVISAAWSVKVPLFYNISACIDFDVRSQ